MGSQEGCGAFEESLTLDEVETQLRGLGKPLGSMNLDELLKVVSVAWPSCLHGGLTLSRDLTNKTVEEVWRDLHQQQQQKKIMLMENDGNNNNNEEVMTQHGQPDSLGRMTLEDFLLNAGVVTQSLPGHHSVVATDPMPQQSTTQWRQYQQLPSVHNQHDTSAVFVSSQPIQQTHTDLPISSSPPSFGETQVHGKKRVVPGDFTEKTVERKKKRMIKNRESAARSRARKQAYTHELEIKVSRLEEENERLRTQKEMEVLPAAPPPQPKSQLRRTTSAPF